MKLTVELAGCPDHPDDVGNRMWETLYPGVHQLQIHCGQCGKAIMAMTSHEPAGVNAKTETNAQPEPRVCWVVTSVGPCHTDVLAEILAEAEAEAQP